MLYREINFTPDEILVYLRKSRSDDPALSVEEVLQKHESIIDEWSEKNIGAKVPEKNKYREIVSGETLKERPEINIVLRMVENPRYKAVAVVEPQRLTRGDLEDIGRLMKLLKHSDTCIITPVRIYDLKDDYDWDAFERELKRGNDYLEYTKKILNRGRLLSVSQGNYIGSVPPYGYDKTFITDGKRKCPTLTENKEQADIVRLIFDLYVNKDFGLTRICNHLDSLGINPPKGQYWSPPALKDMLENVHYIGKVKWNWRKTVTVVEDSELIKTRPKAKTGDYLIYDGKHQGIVSEELFNAAQSKKGHNHRAKATTKIRNPLAGLLFCQCGRAMSLRTYKSHNGKPRLICDGQTHCKTGSCTYDEAVAHLSELMRQCIDDFELKMKNCLEQSSEAHKKLIKKLEKKLQNIQAREVAQWEAQTDPNPKMRMPQDVFQQLNEKLQKEKESVQQELRDAHNAIPAQTDYAEKIAKFKRALNALYDPTATAEEKNRLLKKCVSKITYTRAAPQRLKSQKRAHHKSTLKPGSSWTSPPIVLDMDLEV